MPNSPASPPVMIIGLKNIAKALGISSNKVRRYYLGRKDFPIRRECKKGPWASTRQALADWAKKYTTNNSIERSTT